MTVEDTRLANDAPLYFEPERPLWRQWPFLLGSVLVHGVVAWMFLLLPAPPPLRAVSGDSSLFVSREVTPLYAPTLGQLTQRAPNQGPVAKDISLDGLTAPATAPVAPSTPSARGRRFEMAQSQAPVGQPQLPAGPPPPVQVEAPVVATNRIPDALQQLPQAPPPPVKPDPAQVQAPAKPKISFESVRGQANEPRQGPSVIPQVQQQTAADLARVRPSGGQSVGDDVSFGSQGAGPAKPRNRLELMSDPQGVDFNGWLQQVLYSVKRNWLAVLPESARLGRQGKSVLQFAVRRDGTIAKVVVAIPSGADALDRAAVAGLSASDPLPALPAGFKGTEVRLQMVFAYNQ